MVKDMEMLQNFLGERIDVMEANINRRLEGMACDLTDLKRDQRELFDSRRETEQKVVLLERDVSALTAKAVDLSKSQQNLKLVIAIALGAGAFLGTMMTVLVQVSKIKLGG